VHAAITSGLVSAPQTALHWGALLLATGFALLLLCVAVNWLLRDSGEEQRQP
jgi:hypothetical protein